MAGEKRAGPSFFKVILDASAPQLRIPRLFVCKFREKLKPSCLLEVNGRSWSVKIEEIGRLFFFTQGWCQFAEDNRLKFGDFLVFQLNRSLNFHVKMFDTTCCEKEDVSPSIHHDVRDLRPRTPKRAMENPCERAASRSTTPKRAKTGEIDAPAERPRNVHVKKEIKSEEDTNGGDLGFSMLFTHANKLCMTIPEDFAQETGIANQRRVVLLDPKGKKWPIDVRRRQDGRMKMINDGWDGFRKAFKVLPGVKCVFQFVQTSRNVLRVQVIKRGRGRPPKY